MQVFVDAIGSEFVNVGKKCSNFCEKLVSSVRIEHPLGLKIAIGAATTAIVMLLHQQYGRYYQRKRNLPPCLYGVQNENIDPKIAPTLWAQNDLLRSMMRDLYDKY